VNNTLKEPGRLCGQVTFANVPRGSSYAFKYGPIGRAAEFSWPDENATSPEPVAADVEEPAAEVDDSVSLNPVGEHTTPEAVAVDERIK